MKVRSGLVGLIVTVTKIKTQMVKHSEKVTVSQSLGKIKLATGECNRVPVVS